ncbi:transcription antitermination factor NusB [Hippea alviniae]|uniref:transcription antitermination factor NusB n=1 Tax=Hippea alviniae TaxID=1279027 RepID=UPI0003B7A289|nr:transcription antitermination factor NusB [Hippea alviniae]
MSLRKARATAVHYLYSTEFDNKDDIDSFIEFVGHPKKENEKELTKKLIKGTLKNLLYIDSLIKKYAKSGDDIMSLIDKAILRVGIYELLFLKQAHPIITINEYVNIAKEYSKDSSKALVNAILDRVYKGELENESE